MTRDEFLETLASARYAQLRTYRRDGSPVDTPIWFALDADVVTFRTKQGPKTRRIAANPTVELWPCDYRGRYVDGASALRGEATILDGAAAQRADRVLHGRYGWQYHVVPLLKVPGVKNVDHDLPLREKLRRATSRTLWPDSAVVAVKFSSEDPKTVAPVHSSIRDGSQRRG
jgi:PPOX class probable F420-dependent enzyme